MAYEEERKPEAELIDMLDLPMNKLKLGLWGTSAARDDSKIPGRAERCVWSFEHNHALEREIS